MVRKKRGNKMSLNINSSLDRKFWLSFIGSSLLGGLIIGVCGGLVAGIARFFVGFSSDTVISGAIGGGVGGYVAGKIQWLGLRWYVSKPRGWVKISSGVGALIWFTAIVWAEDAGPTFVEVSNVGIWLTAGAIAGAAGGIVSGILQTRILSQDIPRVAYWWIMINTIGWGAGGIVFIPAFWVVFIGLVGGGNPGWRAERAINSNEAICNPACLILFVILLFWVGFQNKVSRK
jgi:hypothetical protein